MSQDELSDHDDPRPLVVDWATCPPCKACELLGRHVRLAPFQANLHAAGLWSAFGGTALNDRVHWFAWPDMQGPEDLARILASKAKSDGWSSNVMLVDEHPVGMASYMRENAAHGVVEIGAVAHAPELARSIAATEAHFLLMRHAFALGYRRYEWKCDNANAASKRAALRLGFTHEGLFRQHMVSNGRNRDTAWFSILDHEWPARESAFEHWLDPANFDENGIQRTALAARVAPTAG